MANPGSLTVNSLAINSSDARPAAQTIDSSGTVAIASSGDFDGRIFAEFTNNGTGSITVTIEAGSDASLAFRKDIGDLSGTLTSGASKIFGPLETARFSKTDGNIDVSFTGTFAGGTPTVSVRVYKV